MICAGSCVHYSTLKHLSVSRRDQEGPSVQGQEITGCANIDLWKSEQNNTSVHILWVQYNNNSKSPISLLPQF